MLLKRCYVQGFGKLREFSYEFTKGLNVICTENGWGKSTFAAFLRAMFYGLSAASARTKLEEAERRKYRPWDGGVMGGYLEFEVNGKEYRAERTFGKKEAEDTFRLIDLATNLESPDFSVELGKELFGLDKEAYSRSTYLPQNKISDGGMNDSIGKKLGKMAEGDDDSGNFDKAYVQLDELRKKYIPDRQKDEKGYVAELTRKLSEAQARLENCRRKEEGAKPWREKEQEAVTRRKEAEAKLTHCRESLENAAAYEALAAKKQHYAELRGQEEGLRIKKESMEGLFRAGVPELSELKFCRQAAEDAAELTGELRSYRLTPEEQDEFEELHHRFGAELPDREELQECIRIEGETKEALLRAEHLIRQEKGRAEYGKKRKKLCFLLATLFFVLTVVFGVLAFAGGKKAETIQESAGMQSGISEITEAQVPVQKEEESSVKAGMLGLCGTSALAFAVLAMAGARSKKEEHSAEKIVSDCSTDIEHLREQRTRTEALLEQYDSKTETDVQGALYRLAEEAGRFELLSERKNRQAACLDKRDELLRECTDLLLAYGMETDDAVGNLHILETRTREFIRVSGEYAEAVKKREQFEQETPPENFYGLTAPEVTFRELQAEEQELLVRISRETEEEKDCRERAEVFEEEAEEAAETQELCEELQNALEAKKREHFFVTETLKCLKTAKEQFSSRYLRGLTEGFNKFIALLGQEDLKQSLCGYFDGVRTDIDLNVQVTAYGEGKELGYFSTGTRDLLGLCMRFALVDALFAEEEPVLVLDDPFVNLDKEKTERALAFLREAAKQYQMIYLVCHESRA